MAMDCYIIQHEPLLMAVRSCLSGLTVTNFDQLDEDYCDDIEFISSDILDLVKFDKVMRKFEVTSGAMLSRNVKSKVMGLGAWRGKEDWPEEISWIKSESQLKIFGFLICPTYQETLEKTWSKVVISFERTLFSWSSRSLETLSQRVEVVKMFAMSKLYYVAQVLPLLNRFRKRIERGLSTFIFRGRQERLSLSEIENTRKQGGLGLVNIAIKSECLLLRQTVRVLTLFRDKSYRHRGYWLGSFLTNTGGVKTFLNLRT